MTYGQILNKDKFMAGYIGFPRPTIKEIRGRVQSDLNTSLPGQDSTLRFSPLNALSETVVGASQELYGYLDWVARQTNLLDCEDEQLDKYGQIWAVTRIPAAYAKGSVVFSGINGTHIPPGTILQSSTGTEYKTTGAATIYPVMDPVPVQCTLPGSEYNIPAGETLSLGASISGLNSDVTVATMTNGADTESDSSYRQRILKKISQPPRGGSVNEWINWTMEYPGVTRAWCFPQELGSGTVTIRFMMDDTYPDGIPTQHDVDMVKAHLEQYRPVACRLFVFAPITTPQHVVVYKLDPDNPFIRSAAVDELRRAIKEKGKPNGVMHVSWLWEAVSLATGCKSHLINYPPADVIYNSPAFIPVLGDVTFT